MLASEAITTFELYVDDLTELSPDEELSLLEKVVLEVASDRPWEVLKKEFTGTLSTSVPYVSLPNDFAYLIGNNEPSDTTDDSTYSKAVFVGSSLTPYRVINWSERKLYNNEDGYCYLDIANSRLYFTKQPTAADTFYADYISVPTIALGDELPFPSRFHPMFAHLMAADDEIIQRSDKARSNQDDHRLRAAAIKQKMDYWNAQLVN